MHTLVASRLFAWPLLLACPLLMVSAQAAEPAPQPAAVVSHTSRAGETLEKIATQRYPGSPLQSAVLARQLQEANAATVGATPVRKRLKPGTVLEIPSHEQMLRKALGPHLPAESLATTPPASPESRKHWVHYP